jgi:hypothetical protein
VRRAAGWIIEHCDYPADEAERQALIRDLVNARANPIDLTKRCAGRSRHVAGAREMSTTEKYNPRELPTHSDALGYPRETQARRDWLSQRGWSYTWNPERWSHPSYPGLVFSLSGACRVVIGQHPEREAR